ncbi:hypothetical protein C4D60_Mb10t28260 [Musa balbisiana]|uniref:Uncharacterized protein n=1 Tax=Musa balbisiana TaxID=52838 RepID=A0A4S8J1V6_MUSBA|nr:hypothetical protein C4D60_Mb10t28260 [Musa balbisiana]
MSPSMVEEAAVLSLDDGRSYPQKQQQRRELRMQVTPLDSSCTYLFFSPSSVLLGAAVVVERSSETMWKMNNSGKSFEEAMESIEQKKANKEKT